MAPLAFDGRVLSAMNPKKHTGCVFVKDLYKSRGGLHTRTPPPCWPRIAVAWCAVALAWVILGTGQSWALGSAPYFTKLTGSGQSLTEARFGALAANLPSGQVLIAGGYNPSGYLTSAELFNPATDTFTKLSGSGESLTEARYGAVAATLPSGEVLIAGGYNGDSILTNAELFNPATNSFTTLSGSGESLTETRFFAVAATLPSGEVLIAGGYHPGTGRVSSAELFDPATDTFTKLTESDQLLTQARYGPVAATLPSGQVLIAGGYNYTSRVFATAELFSPATDMFTKLTETGQSLTEARFLGVSALLPSGEVLIAGGYDGSSYLSSAELFNPATNRFTELAGSGASLTEARFFGIAAVLPDGQVLIAGGYNSSSGYLSSAELFFPAAQAQVAGGTFGEQTVGERSSVEVLTVTNVGAQALSISGATLAGANAADFAVTADACQDVTLAFRQACTISVSFTPASEGAAKTVLTLNDDETEPAALTLSGTGVAAIHGPQGEEGAPGATGPTGPQGAPAPRSAKGELELVTCTATTIKGRKHRHCTTEVLSTPAMITANAKDVRASLVRGGKLRATGRLVRSHGLLRLVFDLRRGNRIPAGAYTLRLSWTAGKTTHASRRRITLE